MLTVSGKKLIRSLKIKATKQAVVPRTRQGIETLASISDSSLTLVVPRTRQGIETSYLVINLITLKVVPRTLQGIETQISIQSDAINALFPAPDRGLRHQRFYGLSIKVCSQTLPRFIGD